MLFLVFEVDGAAGGYGCRAGTGDSGNSGGRCGGGSCLGVDGGDGGDEWFAAVLLLMLLVFV